MANVVVDSNVYISALVFGGAPQQVLELIRIEGWPLYVSSAIANEVSGTLSRKFGWTSGELTAFLSPLWDRCVLIKPDLIPDACTDPDDNFVLACAAAASAEYLVTGNTKHFPKHFGGTRVVTPRQFLQIVLR